MIHTYIDAEKAKQELIKVYKENEGRISIAFNFNTVHFNEIGAGEHYDKIVKILVKLNQRGAALFCYNSNQDRSQEEIERQLFLLNLPAMFLGNDPNDFHMLNTVDLIVDQRCGLAQVYDELNSLLEIEL
jgi:hypothetical protein